MCTSRPSHSPLYNAGTVDDDPRDRDIFSAATCAGRLARRVVEDAAQQARGPRAGV